MTINSNYQDPNFSNNQSPFDLGLNWGPGPQAAPSASVESWLEYLTADECWKIVKESIESVREKFSIDEYSEHNDCDKFCFETIINYFEKACSREMMFEGNNEKFKEANSTLVELLSNTSAEAVFTDQEIDKALLYLRKIVEEIQRKNQLAVDTIADCLISNFLRTNSICAKFKKAELNCDPIGILCRYTKHPSIEQFLIAAAIDNKTMIEACINKNFRNPFRITPFQIALINGNHSLAQHLLDNCSTPFYDGEPLQDEEDYSVLHLITTPEIAQLLASNIDKLKIKFDNQIPLLAYFISARNFEFAMPFFEKKPKLLYEKYNDLSLIEHIFKGAKSDAKGREYFQKIVEGSKATLTHPILEDMAFLVEIEMDRFWERYLPQDRNTRIHYLGLFIMNSFENKTKTLGEFVSVCIQVPEVLQVKDLNGKRAIEILYDVTKDTEQDQAFFHQLMLQINPQLSHSILSDMALRVELGESVWKKYLPHQLDSLQHSELSQEQIRECCQDLTITIRKFLKLHNLNPENIYIKTIADASNLKKQAKKIIPAVSNETWYREFVTVYDSCVEKHPLLRVFRIVSREVRNESHQPNYQRSDYVKKFTAIWESNLESRVERVKTRKKITVASIYINNIPLHMRIMALVHGTKSTGIDIMTHLGALQASGKLVEQGFGLLSGEGSRAVKLQNKKGISSLSPEKSWEQPSTFLFKFCPSRYSSSKQYGIQCFQTTGNGIQRPLEFTLERLYVTLRSSLASLKIGALTPVLLFDFKRAILNLRMLDPEFVKKTESELKEFEGTKFPENTMGHVQQKELLELWTGKPPLYLDKDSPLITDPVPLLFASNSYEFGTPGEEEIIYQYMFKDEEGNYFDENGAIHLSKIANSVESPLYRASEVFVYRPLRFGQDLQFLFTDNQHIQTIKNVFKRFSEMQVYPFEVGSYLATRQLDFGTPCRLPSIDKEVIDQYDEARDQIFTANNEEDQKIAISVNKTIEDLKDDIVMTRTVSKTFHRHVLPYYAEPFPESPKTPSGFGISQYYGLNVSRTEYLQKIEMGTMLPRPFHGPMHAARAMLYAFMLCEIYRSNGNKLTVPFYYIALAAGLHDSGRESDYNKDYWDANSARNFRRQVQGHLNPKMITTLSNAIQYKDIEESGLSAPEKERVYSKELEIIHDADCLEFLRVLGDKSKFDRSYLYFEYHSQEALVNEVSLFISMTDTFEVQKWMHDNSSNYLRELGKIFDYLNQKAKCFPIMGNLLESTLVALDSRNVTLSEDLTSLLDRAGARLVPSSSSL